MDEYLMGGRTLEVKKIVKKTLYVKMNKNHLRSSSFPFLSSHLHTHNPSQLITIENY